MDRRVRRREALRMLLGAVGFVLAILIGFALGLRVGDRRNNPSRDRGSDSTAFLAAIPDTTGAGSDGTIAGSSAAALSDTLDAAAVSADNDSTGSGAGSTVSGTAKNTPPHRDTLKGKMAEIARKEAARGAEYLTSHNRWNRDEMEKISALQGLWDAVNTYDLEEIRRYNEVFDCPPLATIIEGLERTHKKGYYASKKDHVITLSTYIKRLQ